MLFDPWQLLRTLPHITLVWADLNSKSALTNGTDTVWLDRQLLQVERRCSLTHELIHIERGHTSCPPNAAELEVRVETARRLIPMSELIEHKRWSRSVEELADCLFVTPHVLLDRIGYLSDSERAEFLTPDEESAC